MPKKNSSGEELSFLQKLWSLAPVTLVFFCVGYGAYVYLHHAQIPFLSVPDKRAVAITELVFFAIIFTMWLWTFVRALFTDPGGVPPEWLSDVVPAPPDQTIAENGTVTVQYKTVEKKSMGGVRFCRKCKFSPAKPDRTHHCSICNTCILKMDHHCPWINNCIGFFNYKFFFLFIVYSTILAWFAVFTLLPQLIEALQVKNLKEFTSRELHVTAVFVMAAMLGCAVGTLTSFHIYLTMHGLTTIELLEKKRKAERKGDPWRNPYNLGTMNNIKQVLGENPALWFIPTRAGVEGQGVFFPTNELRIPTGDEPDDPTQSFLH